MTLLGQSQSCLPSVLDLFSCCCFFSFSHLLKPLLWHILVGRNCPLAWAVKFFQEQMCLICPLSLKGKTCKPRPERPWCSHWSQTQNRRRWCLKERQGRCPTETTLLPFGVSYMGRNWSSIRQYCWCAQHMRGSFHGHQTSPQSRSGNRGCCLLPLQKHWLVQPRVPQHSDCSQPEEFSGSPHSQRAMSSHSQFSGLNAPSGSCLSGCQLCSFPHCI